MKKIFILFTLFVLTLMVLPFVKADDALSNIDTYSKEILSKDSYLDNGFTNSKNGWTSVAGAYNSEGKVYLPYSTPSAAAKEFPGIYQDVVVEPFTDYVISVMVKKYGNISAETLFIGYRNPNADNVWTPVQEMNTLEVKNDWQQIIYVVNSGALSEIRIESYTTTITHQDEQPEAGYEFDEFKLCKMADVVSSRIDLVQEETNVGNKVDANVYVNLDNGEENVRISNNTFLEKYFGNNSSKYIIKSSSLPQYNDYNIPRTPNYNL